jgi:hypothetical protein
MDFWEPQAFNHYLRGGRQILRIFAVTALLNTILSRNPDANPRIIATGHSLGGALAVLYVAMLRYRTKEGLDGNQVKPNDKILRNLEVYTFGQPRIRDPIFAQNNDQLLKDRYYHVVDEKDPVPRAPPHDKVFEYKHFGTSLYYHDGKREVRTHAKFLDFFIFELWHTLSTI